MKKCILVSIFLVLGSSLSAVAFGDSAPVAKRLVCEGDYSAGKTTPVTFLEVDQPLVLCTSTKPDSHGCVAYDSSPLKYNAGISFKTADGIYSGWIAAFQPFGPVADDGIVRHDQIAIALFKTDNTFSIVQNSQPLTNKSIKDRRFAIPRMDNDTATLNLSIGPVDAGDSFTIICNLY